MKLVLTLASMLLAPFTPTFKLARQLLAAKQALKLAALLKKLDRYAFVVLD